MEYAIQILEHKKKTIRRSIRENKLMQTDMRKAARELSNGLSTIVLNVSGMAFLSIILSSCFKSFSQFFIFNVVRFP